MVFCRCLGYNAPAARSASGVGLESPLRLCNSFREFVPFKALLTVVLLVAGLATVEPSASALDYERNDVSGRFLGFGITRAPVKAECRTCSPPLAAFLRAFASRHRRYLYVAAEAQAGALFDGRPWLGVGGAMGLETADNAFVAIRGYGELGVNLTYMNSIVADYLDGHTEFGIRYQVRDFARPHMTIQGGLRLGSNFSHFMAAITLGVLWTFD